MRVFAIKWVLVIVALAVTQIAQSGEIAGVHISGETYLGISGRSVQITMGSEQCTLKSEGSAEANTFRLLYTCNDKSQILWDMAEVGENKLSYDEPRFELLWAGDRDGDGKIDVSMEMSPKYSCSRRVDYLSTLAVEGQLLGISGNPDVVCGA